MTRLASLDEFSVEVASSSMEEKHNGGHPRFSQILCRLNGTHPDVRIGQIWEDLDSKRKRHRYVMVTEVRNDGTVSIVNVYVGGDNSTEAMGSTSSVAIHRFTPNDSKRGFRLRSIIIPLLDTGDPKVGYPLPSTTSLSDFIKTDPIKRDIIESNAAMIAGAARAAANARNSSSRATDPDHIPLALRKKNPTAGTSLIPIADRRPSNYDHSPLALGEKNPKVGTDLIPIPATISTAAQSALAHRAEVLRPSAPPVARKALVQRIVNLFNTPENDANSETILMYSKMAKILLEEMMPGSASLFAMEYKTELFVAGIIEPSDTIEFMNEFRNVAREWRKNKNKNSH